MAQCSTITSPLLRLHQGTKGRSWALCAMQEYEGRQQGKQSCMEEIVSLVELLHPTQAEIDDRKAAVEAVSAVVKSIWEGASVEVFGSFATGLFVPTSDVDLVVLGTGSNVQTGLKALATLLSRKGIAKAVQVIGKAKVPIIKFETVDFGNLAFDISFDVPNGPQAAVLVKEVIDEWPMIRPLVLVLKLFLQQRELNEVYTGGIGSYALITMLIAFLQLHNSRRRSAAPKAGSRVRPPASQLEPSLGVLLIDFFRLYGRVINMRQVGISATGGGHYFAKDNKDGVSWVTEGREYMLSVEDPKDPANDICKSSYNIMRVKAAFDFAYQQLAAPAGPDESLLQRIIRLGPILASRSRPADPSLQYSASAAKNPRPGSKAVVEDRKATHKKRQRSASDDDGGRWQMDDEHDCRRDRKRTAPRSEDAPSLEDGERGAGEGVRGRGKAEEGKPTNRIAGDGSSRRDRDGEGSSRGTGWSPSLGDGEGNSQGCGATRSGFSGDAAAHVGEEGNRNPKRRRGEDGYEDDSRRRLWSNSGEQQQAGGSSRYGQQGSSRGHRSEVHQLGWRNEGDPYREEGHRSYGRPAPYEHQHQHHRPPPSTSSSRSQDPFGAGASFVRGYEGGGGREGSRRDNRNPYSTALPSSTHIRF